MPDFRGHALALAGAVEQPHHGAPSFRVAGKIFAQLSADGDTALLKLPLSLQEWGQASFPDACRAEPGRWGATGWTRIRWSEIPESEVIGMIESAWAAAAPTSIINRGSDRSVL
ncbi:MAG: MmcQ/YjbR family DNA-binding protein [Sphingomonas sp.]|nr:MmcQ/YjbR family DNA-binding protein [Sphingomonas sp.]